MSKMIEPMLAAPMKKGVISNWTDWCVEEKFDGHRLIVHVAKANHGLEISAFARPRGDGRMIQRELPTHLVAEIEKLPVGVYDGELMGGADDSVGTDATRKDLAHLRSFVVFDVLMGGFDGELSCMGLQYDQRRAHLTDIFAKVKPNPKVLRLATSVPVRSEKDLTAFVKAVWDNDGEGAILKHRYSTYYAGKRSGQRGTPVVWIKIKRVTHAVLTVVGFEASRGAVMGRGQYAIVKLRDDDGNETTCKTKDNFALCAFETMKNHGIGRRLQIEFPKRTRDGGYQGPVIWDRWNDE